MYGEITSVVCRPALRRVLLAALAALSASAPATAEQWSLSDALGTPENLSLAGSWRVRYETLDDTFRAGRSGSDEILVARLLLDARYDFGPVAVGAELQDSRAWLADAETPLGTDDVNAAELLRAWFGWHRESLFQADDELEVTLGRLTMIAGSRRLLSRSNFRNTTNAFTGIQGIWTGADGRRIQAFYVAPVQRRPGEFASLLDNESELDREVDGTRFWGVHYTGPDIGRQWRGELYLFRLREEDRSDLATLDRDLYTPGFRLFRLPAAGAFDWEVETAFQVGDSRATTSNAGPLLDHSARFHHVHVGYAADNAWQTRLVLLYDYASGDDDPTDGDNERYDTLFGGRRFEYGPTGIHGPFARTNISSPGFRLEATRGATLDVLLGYRAVWLASARDALSSAGLQDPSGASGDFVGHQLEARIRYRLASDTVELELGGAWLAKGQFLENAPNASDSGNTTYVYGSVILAF
jgi:hypothetical protein